MPANANHANHIYHTTSETPHSSGKQSPGQSLSTQSVTDQPLTAQAVAHIAHLGRLAIDDTRAADDAASLNAIFSLMQSLQAIDTTGIAPLNSPFDHAQPLRVDIATETNQREMYQAIAPATQDGLYLVPRVIE